MERGVGELEIEESEKWRESCIDCLVELWLVGTLSEGVLGPPYHCAEINKVFRLLEGLGDKYESIKMTMLRPPSPSYANVVGQLQSYELRNKKFVSAVLPAHSVAFEVKTQWEIEIPVEVEAPLEAGTHSIVEDALRSIRTRIRPDRINLVQTSRGFLHVRFASGTNILHCDATIGSRIAINLLMLLKLWLLSIYLTRLMRNGTPTPEPIFMPPKVQVN
ncbi:hypothetical protein CRG98_019041 [Punica granatum]|uniref:Uncharacterized protein n=1 Tax=Punica granatum TaxID=22663 RepID=A0A2I0JWA5_PUNGR|nr:hypothetical protein CRG98_019041 [Punica granatum]